MSEPRRGIGTPERFKVEQQRWKDGFESGRDYERKQIAKASDLSHWIHHDPECAWHRSDPKGCDCGLSKVWNGLPVMRSAGATPLKDQMLLAEAIFESGVKQTMSQSEDAADNILAELRILHARLLDVEPSTVSAEVATFQRSLAEGTDR